MKMQIKIIVLFALVFTATGLCEAQWVNDPTMNTVVRDANGLLTVPHVASSPSGNTFVSWYSALNGLTFDMFLQYFDVNGNKLWPDTGLMIGNYPTFTWVSDYCLAVDNYGYAILTYMDKRGGFSDAYAYRISPEGYFSWGPDGIQLTNDPAKDWWQQVLVTDSNDFIFMSFVEPMDTTQNWRISIQERDESGNLLWGEKILDSPDLDYYMPQMILTEQGNLMVSWLAKTGLPDTISGQQNWVKIYLQKFSPDGIPIWPDPVRVDTGKVIAYNAAYVVPYLTRNGSDGAYVIWQSFAFAASTVRVNQVSSEGQVIWQANGIQPEMSIEMESQQPSVFYDAASDHLYVYFLLYKYDGINMVDCWAIGGQKFSSTGERLWGEEPLIIAPFICAMDTAYTLAVVRPAAEGNMCLFYEKFYARVIGPDTSGQIDAFASLIDGDGNYLWPVEKVMVTSALGLKKYFTAGNFAADQWVMAWSDDRQHPNLATDIYAQNVTINGTLGPLSVNENAAGSISSLVCFPNPFQDQLTVTCGVSVWKDVAMIMMFDGYGKTVMQCCTAGKGDPFSYNLNTCSLAPGLYFIEVKTGSLILRSKILKL